LPASERERQTERDIKGRGGSKSYLHMKADWNFSQVSARRKKIYGV
jgi:hypothetical protein